ncbi:MAG: hypothetical protein JNL85_18820 [Rubrivivax sp.]|nr:hypothetical protein [Rubrivivax sp.]
MSHPTAALPPPAPSLLMLPGELLVLFFVRLDAAVAALAVPPPQLLEGLRAARDLLGFEGLQRDEDDRLDELLPWAGSV